jgi:hypothetical protein
MVDPSGQGNEEEQNEYIADGGDGDGIIIGWKEDQDEADEEDAVADDGGCKGEEAAAGA